MKAGGLSQLSWHYLKEPLTHSEYLCSIFISSPLHLNVLGSFCFLFFFFRQTKWKKRRNNLILVKRHCLCLICHLMKFDLFFIEHKFGISQLCFVLISKLLQRIQMLRMFSLFARTEFIWLTMFCSDAWLLKLYSNLQSTQIYYITQIYENWICWL